MCLNFNTTNLNSILGFYNEKIAFLLMFGLSTVLSTAYADVATAKNWLINTPEKPKSSIQITQDYQQKMAKNFLIEK